MEINPLIKKILKENNNIITTEQIIELGFTRALLSLYVKEGLLERERQGVYVLANTVHDDMYTLMLRSNKIIFSHETALYLHGISDRTPFEHTLTVPTGNIPSAVVQSECKMYFIKPELHDLGRTLLKTPFGNEVSCYDLERTICDIVRSRNKVGTETFLAALKAYAARSDKDLNRLYSYAKQLRVSGILRKYLEVLL